VVLLALLAAVPLGLLAFASLFNSDYACCMQPYASEACVQLESCSLRFRLDISLRREVLNLLYNEQGKGPPDILLAGPLGSLCG